jgi:Fur family transcriptional regulator, iron response regulator
MSLNMKPMSREGVAALLRGSGIVPTHQRMEIALLLFSQRRHLSADQILAMINRHRNETSKATVYNTVKLLREKGLLREVVVDPTKIFYDPNTEEHHHLYDVETGELSDIDANEVRLVGLPELPEGTIREGVDVIVRVRRVTGGGPGVT